MQNLWAHGFFIKNNIFNASEPVIDAVNKYKVLDFPLQGVIMSQSNYQNEYIRNASDALTEIKQRFY